MTKHLGPTGDFPQGRLNPADEGALNIALYIEHGKIVMAFGKSIAWLGMDAALSRQVGEKLIALAGQVES